jgi:asparaginyl-tRNA synthetase
MHSTRVAERRLYALYSAMLSATRAFAATGRFQEIVPAFEGVPADHRYELKVNLATKSSPAWTLPGCHTLPKQIAACFLPRVYCIGPCYRDEPNTLTHLDSFYQIEFEVLDFSLRQLIRFVRRFVEHVLAATSSVSSTVHDLSTPSWRIIDLPRAHPDVRSRVQYETYLAAILDFTTSDFVWIVHPPAVVQPSNRRFQKWWADGFELFMPYGRGELASGGVRDRQYTRKYVSRWSAASNGPLPATSAGFGLGVERFIGLLSGNTDLRRVVLPHTRSSVRSRGQ